MKAQELRIGNFVHYKDFDKHDIVIELSEESVLIENIISVDSEGVFRGAYSDIKPIPLTEEWLVKMGGKKDLYSTIKDYSFGDYSVTIIKDVFKFWVVDSIDSSLCIEIKHVHQLQNLYFALTGEELTINEKSPTI